MIAPVRGEWWRWLGVVAGEGAMFLKRTSVCVSHGGGGTLTVCRSVRGRFTRLSQIALMLGLDGQCARREAPLKFPRRQFRELSVVQWLRYWH